METGYEYGQEMRPWVSPSLIEANYILSLSQQELQQVIAAEMEANPALEMDERPTCSVCNSILEGSYCPTCLTKQEPAQEAESLESYDDFSDQMTTQVATRDDTGDFDPMALIASDAPVPAEILADARTLLDETEYPIAEYIVESLDERGFLTMTPEAIADALGISVEHVLSVIDVIQDVAPIGVGARDLKECLLLQAHYLKHSGHEVPDAVISIIEDHLIAFGSHKYGVIAKDLGISVEEIEDARDFIRDQLNPYPLQSATAKSWRSPTDSSFVAPDAVILIKNDELVVEIIDSKYFHLKMNSMYEQLAGQYGRRRGGTAARQEAGSGEVAKVVATDVSDDDKTHVRQYTNRAKLFMSNIHQRRDTLLRISQCICELQENFLRGGVRELRPLTRAIVAQQVGVHESTVSRATANKYVMLPNRKVIPFSDFFTPSLSTKDIIKELIERESRKGEPLTDRRICELLLQQGVRIARRTVAKYRAELGILPSTMR
jgi:RNA polymerase sigma-54 factor